MLFFQITVAFFVVLVAFGLAAVILDLFIESFKGPTVRKPTDTTPRCGSDDPEVRPKWYDEMYAERMARKLNNPH